MPLRPGGGGLCQGRGSAANSLVCYALRVAAVDPVAHDLLFERLVSPERPEVPDIDIDFASDEARERVIRYVYARYRRDRAAMVCVHVEFRGRSALRDAMRGLGYAAPHADALAKRLHGHAGAAEAAAWLDGAVVLPFRGACRRGAAGPQGGDGSANARRPRHADAVDCLPREVHRRARTAKHRHGATMIASAGVHDSGRSV